MKSLRTNAYAWSVVLLTLSLSLPLITTLRLLDHENWNTGANQMTWVRGDGVPLSDPTGQDSGALRCGQNRNRFIPLYDKDVLWNICNLGHDNRIYLAQLDPDAGVGRLWPFPKALRPQQVLGLAKHAQGEIGIVYKALNARKLVFATFTTAGWRRPPATLPESENAEFLAAAYIEGVLNIVYLPQPEDEAKLIANDDHFSMISDRMPIIARLYENDMRTATIPRPRRLCQVQAQSGAFWACVRPCGATYTQGTWRTKITRIDINAATHYEITDAGQSVELAAIDCRPQVEVSGELYNQRDADLSALGHTQITSLLSEDSARVSLQGQVKPFTRVELTGALVGFEEYYQQVLEFRGTELRRVKLWENRALENKEYARAHADGWLTVKTSINTAVGSIVVTLLRKDGSPIQSQTVAKIDDCAALLYSGTPLLRQDGGLSLVSGGGCYVNLGKDLKRLQPLSITEHVSRGGSEHSWRDPVHMAKLYWVLLGLPICIFLCALIPSCRRPSYRPAVMAGSMVYLISGGASFYQLWPVLQ